MKLAAYALTILGLGALAVPLARRHEEPVISTDFASYRESCGGRVSEGRMEDAPLQIRDVAGKLRNIPNYGGDFMDEVLGAPVTVNPNPPYEWSVDQKGCRLDFYPRSTKTASR